MSKFRLLTSIAVAALASTFPAHAETGEESATKLDPFYGRLSPFYGRLSPFEGDIDPFYGRLSPFGDDGDIEPYWGRLSPFEGDIESFWGRLSPFEDGGEIDPFWGRLSPFWGRLSPFMGDLQANWGRLSPFDENDPESHQALIDQLNQLIIDSEAFWGERVEEATGQSFEDGFVADIFAEFGIDLNDPASLDNLSAADRAAFQFAWYDGLMSFSGQDHVDHWMETANWSPSLTQIQGMGTDTVIGLIDFSLTADADLQDNLILWSGEQSAAGGHGGAVASLLVADHDGEGLMGIAPDASVALYNPFDADGTANWDAVTQGIIEVGNAGASVVNLSLGVSGTTFDGGWEAVYNSAGVSDVLGNTVFVHAAGNDGHVQLDDINWDVDTDPALIVVGSIGPNGTVSGFSNTPGEACLVANIASRCETQLMDRFLVAPGEWILVTDGEGGVTRVSGTSFAAPIVTGAVALLQSRWEWLTKHPETTAQIIFATADDLGAPGVDAVYGHGALNIGASQSPIDVDMLYQLGTDQQGRETKYYLSELGSPTVDTLLNTDGGYVTVLEDVGDTFRDFIIPLDELTTGTATSVGGTEELLQTYLAGSLDGLGTSTKGTSNKGRKTENQRFANLFGLSVALDVFPMPLSEQGKQDQLPFASEFSLTSDEGFTLAFGTGVGAMSLSGDAGAAEARFDPETGGANPLLGFASGGSYLKADMPFYGKTTISLGTTNREFQDTYTDADTGVEMLVNETIPVYKANATHVSLSHPVGETLEISAGYTRLTETDGALGIQSTLQGSFDAGTVTDAATVTAAWSPTNRVSFTGAATFGKTKASDNQDTLALGQDGATTTAFEVAMNFEGLFGEADQARIALVQPLHVEDGALAVTTGAVIDRETGERGLVTEEFGIASDRRLAMEASWGTPFLNDSASIAGFVRYETTPGVVAQDNHLTGFALRLTY